jgi:glycosyltransferase involved in cell wall biosynthesis
LAARAGIADRVQFLGFVTGMPELYLASDVLFFPSFFEGTPMTVLEAMASGLPIVASEIDGTAEVLEDGVDALLAPPEQTRIFVELLATLLQDQPLGRRLAKRALAKVREHYGAAAMVREVENLYRSTWRRHRRDCQGNLYENREP